MSELTAKEHDAIRALNADYRLAFFKKNVLEQQGLYILVDEEGPLVLEDTEVDENGTLFSIIPVWSHEQLANDYASDSDNTQFKAQFVTLSVWNEKWVPMFKEQEHVLIGFMPVKDQDFSVDDPQVIA